MISEDEAVRRACVRMAVCAVRVGDADMAGVFCGLYEVAGADACHAAALELDGTPGLYCSHCQGETVGLPRAYVGMVCSVCWHAT